VTEGFAFICKHLELPVVFQSSSRCCQATGEHSIFWARLGLLLHHWICSRHRPGRKGKQHLIKWKLHPGKPVQRNCPQNTKSRSGLRRAREPKFAPATQDPRPSQLPPASPQTHRNRGAPSPPWRSASVDGHIAGACPGGLGLQDWPGVCSHCGWSSPSASGNACKGTSCHCPALPSRAGPRRPGGITCHYPLLRRDGCDGHCLQLFPPQATARQALAEGGKPSYLGTQLCGCPTPGKGTTTHIPLCLQGLDKSMQQAGWHPRDQQCSGLPASLTKAVLAIPPTPHPVQKSHLGDFEPLRPHSTPASTSPLLGCQQAGEGRNRGRLVDHARGKRKEPAFQRPPEMTRAARWEACTQHCGPEDQSSPWLRVLRGAGHQFISLSVF